jgi:hypothetical protein
MERAMKMAHQRSVEAERRIMAKHGLPRGLAALLEERKEDI